MPDLPADIIAYILSRLPVRSLCRFKSVSKTFLSLISNPKFIKQHIDQSNKNYQLAEKLFLLSNTFDCYTLDLESPNLMFSPVIFGSEQNPLHFTGIWGSCDGLVLLYDETSSLYVVNPVTREFRELPGSEFLGNPNDRCGFGFDSSCDDYKVVTISYDNIDSIGNSVSVYNLRANSWRQINSCPYEIDKYENPQVVLLNGALHWLGVVGIISFDLANGKFSNFYFPYNVHKKFRLHLLGVIQGCLSGVDYSNSYDDSIDVWVMEEYGVSDSWKIYAKIVWSASNIESALPLRTGKILLHIGTGLVLYDPKEDEYEQMEVQGFGGDAHEMGYVESLLQLQPRD